MVLMSLCAEIAPELLHLFPENLDKLVTGMVGCKYTSLSCPIPGFRTTSNDTI